jgi:hypothetical protein
MKTFAVVALFFVVNIMSAQAQNFAKNWSELKDTQEVSWRVENNITSNQVAAAFRFTEVILQVSQKLAYAPAPAVYKSKKNEVAVKNLLAKAEELNKSALSKAPEATLLAQYKEYKTILESIQPTK